MNRSRKLVGRLGVGLLFGAIAFVVGAPGAQAQRNRVPFINQPLVPSGAAPGGSTFTLVVTGTGFVSGATVKWNGAPLTTTYVLGSKLKAQVPAADIASAGSAIVTVTQPGTNGPTSNPVVFEIGNPVGSLGLARADYTVGT
ncbi:MAG TPA: IPT/TIG domain-containing protein, partial [Terriglobia bacterium]|nr:IPT/TIG domain-containing protein [Terriglobia bacterium]